MTFRAALVLTSEPDSDAPSGVYVDPLLVVAVSEAVRRVTGEVPPYEAFKDAIGEVLAESAVSSVAMAT